MYLSIFTLLIVLIGLGYQLPQESPSVSNATPAAASAQQSTATPSRSSNALLGEVVSTRVAANVAQATGLAIAPSVSSLAATTQIESQLVTQKDQQSISKPAIMEISSPTRQVTSYTTVSGDTVDSVAQKFGITADTVKWANNLTSNTLTAGTKLDILPRNGVLYTAKQGDTVDSIAQKYKSDAASITSYNDLEISGLTAGIKVIIPNGVLPANERPGYSAPVNRSFAGLQYAGIASGNASTGNTWRIRIGTPMYPGNNYAYGYCTAYVFDRRLEMGKPVRPSWGNASSWAASARAAGYAVNNTPAVGSVLQNGGGAGHVAVVEKIFENGDIELSEMNAAFANGGWNIVSGRILPAASVPNYLYIHS